MKGPQTGERVMQTIRVSEKTDKDGTLSLRIPLGAADAEYDVVIVLQPKAIVGPHDLGWPPGYFDATFGSIDDDTFSRPAQGELPRPVELD
jgi:hypothetical protein